MIGKKEDMQDLLARYTQGNCTDKEKALLEQWYLQLGQGETELPAERIEELGRQIRESLPGPDYFSAVRRICVPAAAVAVTLLLTFAIWLFYQRSPSVPVRPYARNIPPGKSRAFLILAGGKVFPLHPGQTSVLSKAGQLCYQNGIPVGPGIPSGLQTIRTPKGGQYQVELSDGTRVWLNAATSLTFPTRFDLAPERRVKLEGEAYFEVAKDRQHPFVVQSPGQQVHVLGTHFNINAYPEDAVTQTTLLQGAVQITAGPVLRPGEQAINTRGAIHVVPIDTGEAIAWKSGEFMFRQEPLEGILRKVARWYNVEVSYQADYLRHKRFGGTISRFSDLSAVLHLLELTGQVHFQLQERRVIVLE